MYVYILSYIFMSETVAHTRDDLHLGRSHKKPFTPYDVLLRFTILLALTLVVDSFSSDDGSSSDDSGNGW